MINQLIFRLFQLFVFLISITPMWVLHLKSSFVAFLLYRVVGYRKKVVIGNLQKCFPEKNTKEVDAIARNFYRNLSDVMLETLKGFHMSEKQLRKRWKVLNPELLNSYFEQGKDVINLASHYGNWEWGILSLDMQIKHQAVSIYMPMTNDLMERWSRKRRERFGMQLVSIKGTRDFFMSKKPNPVSIILAADQNPSNIKKAIMVKFFGYDTPCLHGAEEYARAANIPLVYFDVQRVKRGYYTLEIVEMFDNPKQTKYGEITQTYMRKVEEIIRRNPYNYLWSHRRWKHGQEQIDQMLEWHKERTADQ
ncbi:MAG: lysophospholipid acyltransferase family protein [Salinivirgaceae bacterium]|nr:lysophospholipid acyltransferase family protein [Salinivirgaceae bacterium]